MIKCLIVDDEPLAHQVLEQYILDTPELSITGKCRNAVEAFEYISQQTVDLMFLDIEMPMINGIQFLKSVSCLPKTIITTAYKEYAYEGFELHVIDYLLKPFAYDRFVKAIEKYKQLTIGSAIPAAEEKFLLVKDHRGVVKVQQKDILYIEGCKDYVKIVTPDKVYLMHQTMKDMAEHLGEKFVRVHRSFIVALDQIKILQPENVILSNNSYIPVGNFYKQQLMDQFKR